MRKKNIFKRFLTKQCLQPDTRHVKHLLCIKRLLNFTAALKYSVSTSDHTTSAASCTISRHRAIATNHLPLQQEEKFFPFLCQPATDRPGFAQSLFLPSTDELAVLTDHQILASNWDNTTNKLGAALLFQRPALNSSLLPFEGLKFLLCFFR